MNINSFTLKNHLEQSAAVEHLSNVARDFGYIKIAEDRERAHLENTLNTLKAAKTEKFSDVDDFITKNFEAIQSYLLDLKKNHGEDWSVSDSFLYELIVLLKCPEIFTKEFQNEFNWKSSAVPGNVERALKKHAPKMTK
ncbi:TPA: hypothetical protein RQ360_001297 [Klebsiella michiganensis]|nr:hypothetical protein [Klebsiella michiganensis]